ncbi:MAG: dihydroneopterin aldolase [Alphaproteobacteria bacterium]|nr:dihydroneopterin aldolase [Alphaproteobacteria bacterium]
MPRVVRVGILRTMKHHSRQAERYTVIVRGLIVPCSIGIRPEEQDTLQRVRVSVELTAALGTPFPGENRRRVINYEKVVAAIRTIAGSGHIDLCEGFAELIAAASFADPRVDHVRITVEKLDVFAEADSVGAILERHRPQ